MEPRLLIFIFTLCFFSCFEVILGRRVDPNASSERLGRKLSNILILVIGTIFSLLLIRLAPVASSNLASSYNFGLFNYFDAPAYLKTGVGIILLDLVIYFQHRAFHYFEFLWRFHRVHHLDNFLDATSALRFHPVEIVLSLFIKSLAVVLFGLSIETILIFEVILSSMAIFNHANLRLSSVVDYYLRFIVVTPNFHAIHHSPSFQCHNSNFGFNLSLWDYLFKTSRSVGDVDFSNYECGLGNKKENSLKGMLLIPFKRG